MMEDNNNISTDESSADKSELSLEDIVGARYDEIEANEEETKSSSADAKPRDEVGRFKAKIGDPASPSSSASPIIGEATAQPGVIGQPAALSQAPNTWTADAKAKFSTLEPWAQQEILKREQDISRGMSAHDQERTFGKSVKEVVSPYLPMIQAEGATPEQAIQSLLNTAYRLRTSSQAEKAQLISGLARQYGVDIGSFQQQDSQPVDPTISALQQEVYRLSSAMTQQRQQDMSYQEQQAQQLVEQFAIDPTHSYFPQVRDQMGKLMNAGLAKDLQDAYEQAILVNPEVRQKVISQRETDYHRKQIEDSKAKAESAKRIGSVNLRSKPSLLPVKTGGQSMEQTIADRYDQIIEAA